MRGVTAIVYDQTCAAEKRRRRKQGQYPDPQKRVFINDLVCEGCGDCGVKSNCVAVVPLEVSSLPVSLTRDLTASQRARGLAHGVSASSNPVSRWRPKRSMTCPSGRSRMRNPL